MATKRQKEIGNMSNGELIRSFRLITIKTVEEENSARGITKKSSKEENDLIEEMSNRFGFDKEELDI